MLKQINISNFAIIEKTSIEFDSNLTVITGQTGAGKSIVIDAIEQLLGARASSSMVSHKEDSAFIEGIFEYNEIIEQLLLQHDIEIEDEYIFITKRIKKDGKSQLRINDRIVRNDLVKQVGAHLVEIHSQHATYLLNEQVNQQKFIDNFFTKEESLKLNNYQELYKQHTKTIQELDDFNNNVVDPELLSFYQDQLKDIEDNLISEDKVEELSNKEKYYQEFEKISNHITSILGYFNKGLKENVNDISIQLDKLSEVNEQYNKISQKANDIYYELDDLYQLVNEEYSNLSFDEYEYDLIKEQLFNYNKMIKKYSYSHEEVNLKIEDLNTKIDYINNSSSLILKLENQIKEEATKLNELAKELDSIRIKYIKKITQQVAKHLDDLHLKDAQFDIVLEEAPLNKNGISKILFLFNANKGNDLQPLNAVASGGELSRLMLALKSVDALQSDKMFIFDEIDTGVSGQVADAIGHKINEIAQHNDVICITHLPQVAVYGKKHLFIEKNQESDFTTSNTYYLNEEQRINEIATMLSGDNITQSALIHAKELLNHD